MSVIVVFIHGIGGAKSTFGNIETILDEMIGHEKDISFDFFEYSTFSKNPSKWLEVSPNINQVSDLLITHLRNLPEHYDEVILVTHSQGGLIGLRALIDMANRDDACRVTRIMNIATPHQGAIGANIAAAITKPLHIINKLRTGGQTPDQRQIDNLAFGSQFMFELTRDWSHSSIANQVVVKNVIALRDWVVSQQSAYFGGSGEDYDVIDAGHTGIFEDIDKTSSIVRSIYRFIVLRVQKTHGELHHQQPFLSFGPQERVGNSLYFGSRITKLLERDSEIVQIERFLAQPSARFSWTILSGSAGVGKSRFALETMIGAATQWFAGFLGDDLKEFDWKRWHPVCPTLLCIDYASYDIEDVKKIIDTLSMRCGRESRFPLRAPIRLILIDRKADTILDQIFDETREAYSAETTYYRHTIVLRGLQEPKLLIEKLFARAGITREVSRDELAKLHALDPDARPLFVMIFAEILANDENDVEIDKAGLIRKVIKRWRQRFWKPAGLKSCHEMILLAASIAGVVYYDKIPLPEFVKTPITHQRTPFFKAAGLRCNAEGVFGLEPDLIGELFVLDYLDSEVLTEAEKKSLLTILLQINPRRVASFVARAAQDFPEHPALGLFLHRPLRPEGLSNWAAMTSVVPETVAKRYMTDEDWITAAAQDVRYAWHLVQTRPPNTNPPFDQAEIDRLFADKTEQIISLILSTHLQTLTSWIWRLFIVGANETLFDLVNTLTQQRWHELERLVLEAPFDQVTRFVTLAKVYGLGGHIWQIEEALEEQCDALVHFNVIHFPNALSSLFQAAFKRRKGISLKYSFCAKLQKSLEHVVANKPFLFLESSNSGDFSWLDGYAIHLPEYGQRLAQTIVDAINDGELSAINTDILDAFLTWTQANLPLVAMTSNFKIAQENVSSYKNGTSIKPTSDTAPSFENLPIGSEDTNTAFFDDSQLFRPLEVNQPTNSESVKETIRRLTEMLQTTSDDDVDTVGSLIREMLATQSSYLHWVLYFIDLNQGFSEVELGYPDSYFIEYLPDGLPLHPINDPFSTIMGMLHIIRLLPEAKVSLLFERTNMDIYGFVKFLNTSHVVHIPKLLSVAALPTSHKSKLLEQVKQYSFRIGMQSITMSCMSVIAVSKAFLAYNQDNMVGRNVLSGYFSRNSGEQFIQHVELTELAHFLNASIRFGSAKSKRTRRKKILGAENFIEMLTMASNNQVLTNRQLSALFFFLKELAYFGNQKEVLPILSNLTENKAFSRKLHTVSGEGFADLIKCLLTLDNKTEVQRILLDKVEGALKGKLCFRQREYFSLAETLRDLTNIGRDKLVNQITKNAIATIDPTTTNTSWYSVLGVIRILSNCECGPQSSAFIDQLMQENWFLDAIDGPAQIDSGTLLKFPVMQHGLSDQSPAFVTEFTNYVVQVLSFAESKKLREIAGAVHLLGLVDINSEQLAGLRAQLILSLSRPIEFPDLEKLLELKPASEASIISKGFLVLQSLCECDSIP